MFIKLMGQISETEGMQVPLVLCISWDQCLFLSRVK